MNWKSRIFSLLGTLLIIFAFVIPIIFYGPLIIVEARYRLRKFTNRNHSATLDPYKAVLEHVPNTSFSLYIPKIDAVGEVIANVGTQNSKEYFEILKTGIAHAKGTLLPGNGVGNIYLFAHSTDSPLNIIRYNAVFYLLRELEKGDEAFLVYEGKPYRYVVTDKKIVEPTDVSYLKPENDNKKEQIILQTCWPPGTVAKRLLIFAQRVDAEEA